MKSSPTNALQVECSDPPLSIRRQYLADRFLFKVIQNSSHPLIDKLHQLSEFISYDKFWTHKTTPSLFRSFLKFLRLPSPVHQCVLNPLFDNPYHSLVYRPDISLDLGISKKSTDAEVRLQDYISKKWNNWLVMYTDASKLSDQECVGAAVWIPKYKIILNFKCPPVSSVFSGEAIAILEALLYTESHNVDKTVILSDSKSCLQAILSNPFRNKSNFPCILKIRDVLYRCHLQEIRVSLAWIPGHSGIVGNEAVDLMAKDATNNSCLTHPQVFCHDLFSLATQKMMSSWLAEWKESSKVKGKYYADIQNFIPKKPWFFEYNEASKFCTSTLCRLRLGHSSTPVHLAKIRIRDNSLCECGLDDGSPDHIFFNCPKYSVSLYDILPPYIPKPTNFKTLLNYVNSPFIVILCNYITSNNIKL
ncbi:uncharacterized protein LOC113234509 [Hyposmocoma kahamanoa]|uniref:uncharacterized protein LOC113234509 n=1 Tax=Hyposmocoma kahamanoa TaxID=1477025 RepID=UPI000E6D6B71|nr:uncharacterized protein LOC113234509 [Hyposmocoma kahamanoa]XP_026325636.1 uncharacterized protein LOC113234509 [Hyposmocoma kahamanoa]